MNRDYKNNSDNKLNNGQSPSNTPSREMNGHDSRTGVNPQDPRDPRNTLAQPNIGIYRERSSSAIYDPRDGRPTSAQNDVRDYRDNRDYRDFRNPRDDPGNFRREFDVQNELFMREAMAQRQDAYYRDPYRDSYRDNYRDNYRDMIMDPNEAYDRGQQMRMAVERDIDPYQGPPLDRGVDKDEMAKELYAREMYMREMMWREAKEREIKDMMWKDARDNYKRDALYRDVRDPRDAYMPRGINETPSTRDMYSIGSRDFNSYPNANLDRGPDMYRQNQPRDFYGREQPSRDTFDMPNRNKEDKQIEIDLPKENQRTSSDKLSADNASKSGQHRKDSKKSKSSKNKTIDSESKLKPDRNSKDHRDNKMSFNFKELLESLKYINTLGTIIEFPNHTPQVDADCLRDAMIGITTDEKAIIKLSCSRTLEQRLAVLKTFNAKSKTPLLKCFKNEMSGNCDNIIVKMYTPKEDYECEEIKRALKGTSSHTESIIDEILLTKPNQEIQKIISAYKTKYGINLVNAIERETNSDYAGFIKSILECKREDWNTFDVELAKDDAKRLHRDRKGGPDDKTFIEIFSSRSLPQLRALNIAYDGIFSKSLREAVKSETKGAFRNSIISCMEIAESTPRFYARKIREVMKRGDGNQDNEIIRIIISRSEIDMVDIKDAYVRDFGSSVESDIKSELVGEYKKILTAIIS